LHNVADADANLVADIDDQRVSADVCNHAGISGFVRRQSPGLVVELRGGVVHGFIDGFAKNGLREVAAAHVEGATAAAVAIATAAA
jgi:hypothetical protein